MDKLPKARDQLFCPHVLQDLHSGPWTCLPTRRRGIYWCFLQFPLQMSWNTRWISTALLAYWSWTSKQFLVCFCSRLVETDLASGFYMSGFPPPHLLVTSRGGKSQFQIIMGLGVPKTLEIYSEIFARHSRALLISLIILLIRPMEQWSVLLWLSLWLSMGVQSYSGAREIRRWNTLISYFLALQMEMTCFPSFPTTFNAAIVTAVRRVAAPGGTFLGLKLSSGWSGICGLLHPVLIAMMQKKKPNPRNISFVTRFYQVLQE